MVQNALINFHLNTIKDHCEGIAKEINRYGNVSLFRAISDEVASIASVVFAQHGIDLRIKNREKQKGV